MSSTPRGGDERSGLRVSPWNFLLFVPLLMLVTPWFNTTTPHLFGIPFFYWYQLAWVPVGVLCVAIVRLRTRDGGTPRDDQEGLQ